MLKKIAKRKSIAAGGKFAIVAARYNEVYTDALVKSAQDELESAGATEVKVVRVPGSFEVTCVAGELGRQKKWDAVICLGVIMRGQTTHAQQIADAVSLGLTQIQSATGVPMIHGVLLFENDEQAKARCLGREHNRGIEAARAAIEMAAVMRSIKPARAK